MSSDLQIGMDWHEQQLVRARLKRAELIKQRDRLGERIGDLDHMIQLYQEQITPEAKKRHRQFWEEITRDHTRSENLAGVLRCGGER